MPPADVENRQACRHAVYNGACKLTLPMQDLWLAVYIADAVLVFFVIPSAGKRIKSSLLWVITAAIVCALVLGIFYGMAFCFDVVLSYKITAFHAARHVVSLFLLPCSSYPTPASSEKTWTMRTTFPEYVLALATCAFLCLCRWKTTMLVQERKALRSYMRCPRHARSQSCPFCRDSLKWVNSGDLWIYNTRFEIVDLSSIGRGRLVMSVEKLPLVVLDIVHISHDPY
ncbi:hypothetical protein MLD38_038398 [Melastoma candidum]|uniref:Uncharacterized protein n=1 Tax=Melastoma candidum TaxID=119954 RepID=A0ACB9KZY9_9MYRT|nr:hypothetical protein MLD38_038398 [Melastoma candidum]